MSKWLSEEQIWLTVATQIFTAQDFVPMLTHYCGNITRHTASLQISKRAALLTEKCWMQVLGHSKTMLVLLGGWAFLGDHVSLKQLAGMALAVIGMVLYGVASSQ